MQAETITEHFTNTLHECVRVALGISHFGFKHLSHHVVLLHHPFDL